MLRCSPLSIFPKIVILKMKNLEKGKDFDKYGQMALAYPDSNDMSVLTVKGIQQILKSCSDLWFGKGRLTLQLALINSPRSYSILVTQQNDRKLISLNLIVKTVPLVNEVI